MPRRLQHTIRMLPAQKPIWSRYYEAKAPEFFALVVFEPLSRLRRTFICLFYLVFCREVRVSEGLKNQNQTQYLTTITKKTPSVEELDRFIEYMCVYARIISQKRHALPTLKLFGSSKLNQLV